MFRMTIEAVFVIKGRGVVATGRGDVLSAPTVL